MMRDENFREHAIILLLRVAVTLDTKIVEWAGKVKSYREHVLDACK